MKLSINWKIITARITAVAGAFAVGGTLYGAIPGKAGLLVTAVAGAINTFLPRAQKSAGILASLQQFRTESRIKKARQVETLIGATVERKVDEVLRTQRLLRTAQGLVSIDAASVSGSVPPVDGCRQRYPRRRRHGRGSRHPPGRCSCHGRSGADPGIMLLSRFTFYIAVLAVLVSYFFASWLS